MNFALKGIATLAGIFIGGSLLLYGCAPWASVRYKLTVEIDDNGALYEGSGVIEAHFQSQGPISIGMSPPWSSSTTGEAFAVDVGSRGALFVLLIGDRETNLTAHFPHNSPNAGRAALEQYLDFNLPGQNSMSGARAIVAFATSKREADIPALQLPLIVWFKDPANPLTIRRVDNAHLDAVLGSGVTIRSVHVAITTDPVSHGIEKRLPWLQNKIDNDEADIKEAFYRAEFRRQSGMLKLADAVPGSKNLDRFSWIIDSNAFREGM